MKRIQVLYISYDSSLEPIPQSQVIPYLNELSKEGYTFHWLTFDKLETPNFKDKRIKMRDELLGHNNFLYSLTYLRKPYLLAKLFNIICGICFASFLVLKNRIIIIHGRGEVASFIGICVKFIFKKKMVYDRRGFMAEDYVEGGMWKGRGSFLYNLLIFIDNQLLAHADAVVVLTNKMKEWLQTNRPWSKGKITVIPCCVALSRFLVPGNGSKKAELGIEGKFLFVYSGSLGTWYLLREMFDFFLVAKNHIPDAHLLILTMSDPQIAYSSIREKNMSRNDVTIRRADFNEIPEYLHCADSALCFIKPVLSKLASSPTKLAEFLASGLPIVINSGIGDCDDIIGMENIGVVVRDFNHEEYRRSVSSLLSLFKDREALRQRCVRSAKKYFSLSDGVFKYHNIYLAFR